MGAIEGYGDLLIGRMLLVSGESGGGCQWRKWSGCSLGDRVQLGWLSGVDG